MSLTDLPEVDVVAIRSHEATVVVDRVRVRWRATQGSKLHAIRWLCRTLFAVPARWLVGSLRRGTEIALASLPEQATGEPAVRQVKRIARSRPLAADKAEFEQQPQQSTG